MSAATIIDPAQLEAAYARAEQLLQEAAEAEHAAFVAWQDAYGAYEVAAMTRPRPPGELGARPGPVAVAPSRSGLETKAARAPRSTQEEPRSAYGGARTPAWKPPIGPSR